MAGPLAEPLLGPAGATRDNAPDQAFALATCGTFERAVSCPCPSSFKAGRPRRTRQVIEEQRRWEARHGHLQSRCTSDVLAAEDVDPLSLDDEAAKRISARVASVIYCHYLDGQGEKGPRGPAEDAFHEAHFLGRGWLRCCQRCCRRGDGEEEASEEMVLELIRDIACSLYFCKQVVVLALVYIERLLKEDSLIYLTAGNWRSLLAIALLTASKVWEDVHPWNADVANCLWDIAGIRYKPGALYRLESLFLDRLRWRVFVGGETYVAYYFTLVQDCAQGVPGADVRISTTLSVNEMPVIDEQGDEEDCLSLLDEDMRLQELRGSLAGIVEAGFSESSSRGRPLSRGSQSRQSSKASRNSSLSARSPERRRLADLIVDDLLTARAINEAWTLDASNPHIGRLRHAPPALAPSPHIRQSSQHFWAHDVAERTSRMVHSRPPSSSAHTLSGATGFQLEHELRIYLDTKQRSEAGVDAATAKPPGELGLGALFEPAAG